MTPRPIATASRRAGHNTSGPNTFVVDLMCDARIVEPASFSSDGFHPSDRGYALMADLAYPAAVNPSHPAPAADCGGDHRQQERCCCGAEVAPPAVDPLGGTQL